MMAKGVHQIVKIEFENWIFSPSHTPSFSIQ